MVAAAAKCMKLSPQKRRKPSWGRSFEISASTFPPIWEQVDSSPDKREWEEIISKAASGVAFAQLRARTEMLEMEIAELHAEMISLKESSPSIGVINWLPEPEYSLSNPIVVSVRMDSGEFIASFDDASIAASGETKRLALENLSSMLLSLFDMLKSRDIEKLGPLPLRQLSILDQLISKIEVK